MDERILFARSSLCVVGNINRDIKLQNVPDSADLLLDGETSVTGIVETIGGGAANSACAAAALGAAVRLLGKIGADALGEQLQRALERHGVRTCLVRDAGTQTGTTVALGYQSGHRHFLSRLPNNERLSFEDLDLTALDGCGHLLRADVWFSQAMLENGNRRLLAEARRHGLTTSVDINYDPRWSAGTRSEISERKRLLGGVLDLVDLAHGNVRELCEFTETSDLRAALERLTGWGVKSVVVHLGKQGAGFWTDGQLVIEPPDLAQRMINSTGTGDVLSVCLMLLHQHPDLSVRQKLRLANRVVREFIEGTRPMLPSL